MKKKKKIKSRTEITCLIKHFAAIAAFRKKTGRYFQFRITMYNTQRLRPGDFPTRRNSVGRQKAPGQDIKIIEIKCRFVSLTTVSRLPHQLPETTAKTGLSGQTVRSASPAIAQS